MKLLKLNTHIELKNRDTSFNTTTNTLKKKIRNTKCRGDKDVRKSGASDVS